MKTPQARIFTRLAVAIVAAAIIISATALSYSATESTVTKSSTFTTTYTATFHVPTTNTTTSISTTTSTGGTSRLYELEFIQQSACPGGVWLAPWAVTLNNQTIVRPSGATLPLSEGGFEAGHSSENYSTISFSVPNGNYSYIVYPQNFLHQSGNVTVHDNDVVVQVGAAPVACTTTTTGTDTSAVTQTTTVTSTVYESPSIASITISNATVGGNPSSAAIDQSTGLIYLTNTRSLTELSVSSNQVTGSIPLNETPSLVSVNPKTDTLYVNNGDCPPCSDSIVALNATTGKQLATINLGIYIDGIAVDANTNTVYAVSADNGMLYVINGATNALVSKVAMPGPIFGLVVDPMTDTVYLVACTSSAVSLTCETNLYAVNGASVSVTDMGAVDQPDAMTMNTMTDTIYIASEGTFTSVNGATGVQNSTRLSAFPMRCYGMTIDPLEGDVFVSCQTNHPQLPSLFILDGRTDQVLNSFTISGSPAGMVFDGNGGSAYLVNQKGYVLQLLTTFIPLP